MNEDEGRIFRGLNELESRWRLLAFWVLKVCLKFIEEDYRCWRCLYKRWRPRKSVVHVIVQVSVDWWIYQSTGGSTGVLCRFSAGISRLVVPVSRLMAFSRVEQLTNGASQSTGSCPETSPVD